MCETQTLLQSLIKCKTSSSIIRQLLEEGWLVRPVAPPIGCYGGYALCRKCLTIISWWVCPPPEYGAEITVQEGFVNSILQSKFEEDLCKTVMMLKKINDQEVWVPVNIPI
jgi:hypothetical protein